MSQSIRRMQPLDHEVATKIRSSSQISSLNQIVVELVTNAIDAGAKRIKIDLSYVRGYCSVLDNGSGIPSEEFAPNGRLARIYCTSKESSLAQVGPHHGTALAAIAGVSLMAIESQTKSDRLANLLWSDASGHLSSTKTTEHAFHTRSGTRVRVYNLFAGLPVRKKFLNDLYLKPAAVQAEFDRLKLLLIATILCSPTLFDIEMQHLSSSLSYRHRNRASGTPSAPSTSTPPSLAQIEALFNESGLCKSASSHVWTSCRLASAELTVHAAICLSPLPHKLLQFIILDDQLLDKSSHGFLYDSVNDLFRASDFARSPSSEDRTSWRDLAGQTGTRRVSSPILKRPDRWPMFAVWMQADHFDFAARETYTNREKYSHGFIPPLRAMFLEFLKEHKFEVQDEIRIRKVLSDESHDLLKSLTDRQQHIRHFRDQIPYGRSSPRVKASSSRAGKDISVGLPLHESSIRDDSISVGRLDDDRVLESISSDYRACQFVSKRLLTSSHEDQPYDFLDTTTGRTYQIDPRTGMVLTKPSAFTEKQNYMKASKRNVEALPASSKCNKTKLNLNCALRTVQRYHRDVFASHNDPMSSMRKLKQSAKPLAPLQQNGWTDTSCMAVELYASLKRLGSDSFRVSRHDLTAYKMIRQVDQKFILFSCGSSKSPKIILADQHAVDERCKIETLLQSMHEPAVVQLSRPLVFEIAWREAIALQSVQTRLAQFGIRYDIDATIQWTDDGSGGSRGSERADESRHAAYLKVSQLPAVVAERCCSAPDLMISLLRDEIWPASDAEVSISRLGGPITSQLADLHHTSYRLPNKLLDLLNSRACRSAIMFNDKLSDEHCANLINEVSSCMLPFQCAHGRPSMAVLAELGQMPYYDALQPAAVTDLQSFNHTETTIMHSAREPSQGRPWSKSYANSVVGLNTCDQSQTPTFAQKYRAWVDSH